MLKLMTVLLLTLSSCGQLFDDDDGDNAPYTPVLSGQSTKLSIAVSQDSPGFKDPKSRSLYLWTSPIALNGKSGAVIYFRISPSLFERCYLTEEHKTEQSSVWIPKMEVRALFGMQADQMYDSDKRFPLNERLSGIVELPTLPGNYMVLALTGGNDGSQVAAPRESTRDGTTDGEEPQPPPEDKTPMCNGTIDFEVTAK